MRDPEEGWDIASDELWCDEQYQEKGFFERGANFRCQSLHYNEDSVRANLSLGIVMIHAMKGDGNPQCYRDEDETINFGLPVPSGNF